MANPNDLNLIPNVTEVYIASDGTILDTVGSSIFHAQSNYANLLSVYIEDGTASDTTTLINFTPTNSFTGKVPTYTSHWFFMSTEGIVQKTISGVTRSFVHFYVKVPNIVLRYNSGSQQVQNTVTVIQRYGSNYIGHFADVAALELEYPASENENNLATAYVLEDNGFFQVSDGEWVEVQQLNAALQTKQYNTFPINIQAGLSSTFDVTPIETLAAQMIMNAVANVEAQFVDINSAIINNANDIDDLEMRMDAVEDDIDDLQNDRLLTDGSNADSNISINNVTFNSNIDTDAIQQTDFAAFAEQGKTNLEGYIDSVQDQLDVKLEAADLELDNYYDKDEVDTLLTSKSDIGHTHVEADITDLDKYSQSEVDGLLDEKAELVHTHVESDITDLDKYSTSQADTKFMAKEDYVDVNDKILLSKIPDITKQQTYIVATVQNLPTENLIVGEKAYVTSDGDAYIWDGVTWLVLSKADWENVNLDWTNITNAPKADGNGSLANSIVYTKSQADTLLSGKSNVGHTHTESEITDLDKYTQAQVDTLLSDKANTIHTHTESDITDLDKYTQAQVDDLIQVAKQIQYYPSTKNMSGVQINKGDVVQFAGSQGDFILIKKAVASEINAMPKLFMGLAESNIPHDSFGNVVFFGNVSELSLNALNVSDGDILWFDIVNGGLTKTEPTTNKIIVAAVQKAGNNSNGILLVRPDFVSRTIAQVDGLETILQNFDETLGDIETALDTILGV